jgi:glycosyltransferase involved in cell wall biosynthesis
MMAVMSERQPEQATSGGGGLPGGLRVALVHDWLTGMRGGEKVLAELCRLFPRADIYTLLHVAGSTDPVIEAHPIHTSFLQRLPRIERYYRQALPIFPLAVESFDLNGYDLVLSSSHCVAKSARAPLEALSVCYCHTPMRYIRDTFADYFGHRPWPQRKAIGAFAAWLRRWDTRTSRRVRLWLANSREVRDRIRTWYGVPEGAISVIHPPVDTEAFRPEAAPVPPPGLTSRGYELVVSALVPYKRIDLAILAAKQAGRQLVVVGGGPEAASLRQLADSAPGTGRVIFAGAVHAAALPAYYVHCRSFLFPGREDFGITPLEATACGRPVVAYRAGGLLDSLVPGLNGIFFEEQSVGGLRHALADPRLDGRWDEAAMRRHAARFGPQRFRRQIGDRLGSAWRRHLAGEREV